jgi:hypothetical protein
MRTHSPGSAVGSFTDFLVCATGISVERHRQHQNIVTQSLLFFLFRYPVSSRQQHTWWSSRWIHAFTQASVVGEAVEEYDHGDGDGSHHSVDLDPDGADVLDRSAIACSTSKEIDQRRVQEWQTLVSNLSTRVSLSHPLRLFLRFCSLSSVGEWCATQIWSWRLP